MDRQVRANPSPLLRYYVTLPIGTAELAAGEISCSCGDFTAVSTVSSGLDRLQRAGPCRPFWPIAETLFRSYISLEPRPFNPNAGER